MTSPSWRLSRSCTWWSSVIGEHAGVFFHSALGLVVLIEFVGFAYGLAAALRKTP